MIRFTKTEKWDDPWFRKLTVSEKVLFLFLIDQCDCAGFWEIDAETAIFHTKLRGFDGALKGLEKSVHTGHGYAWVSNFLYHQKNLPLNADNRAHRPIIMRLKEMVGLFPQVKPLLNGETKGPSKGLQRPIGIGIGKGIGKSKGKSKGYSDEFLKFWEAYPRKVGKGAAWVSWQKNNPPLVQVLATVEKYKASPGWKKDGGQFIPHPTTWLNQGRWEDEPGVGDKPNKVKGVVAVCHKCGGRSSRKIGGLWCCAKCEPDEIPPSNPVAQLVDKAARSTKAGAGPPGVGLTGIKRSEQKAKLFGRRNTRYEQ